MPVTPPGVPPFQIRPPCTAKDNGAPTDSLPQDMDRVFLLIEDERHLTAQTLLHSVQSRLSQWEEDLNERAATKTSDEKSHSMLLGKANKHKRLTKKEKDILAAQEQDERDEMNRLEQFLQSKQAVIHKLENRCRLFRQAQQNLNENKDWTFASLHFGIKTYYRREADDSLSIKLEGEVKDAALFEQVCVLKEVDLHYKWAPFCSSSLTIADLDKLDLVGWFLIGMPNFGMARDGCFRAVGCDNIQEDGSILLAGQGIRDIMPDAKAAAAQPEDSFLSTDPILDKLDIPPIPTRTGSGRMTIRKFEAVIHVTSPTSCNTRLVANIDPNISFLPASLLEFIMKHLAGVLLQKLTSASKKAVSHPLVNVHAIKMREERDFYQKWLMAKFQAVCDLKGWEMPKVAAFELGEPYNGQLDAAETQPRVHRSFTVSNESPDDGRVTETLSQSVNGVSLSRETDTVSLLSTHTGKISSARSSGMHNPISSYLREMEAKVQKRKDEAVAALRKRAADILIPKELPLEKHERLNELRNAKARRVELASASGVVGASSSVVAGAGVVAEQAENASMAQRLAFRLFSHGTRTRSVVVLTLVTILFIMSYPEPLWRFSQPDPLDVTSTSMLFVQDCLMVVYILMCALPHFLLCDAALIYAFDSLELGSKTGHHVKGYYSNNVHSVVGMGSLGIVTASIAKALFKVWARLLVWSSVRVWTTLHVWAMAQFAAAWSLVPPAVQSMVDPGVAIVAALVRYGMVSMSYLALAARTVFLKSNPIGRMITWAWTRLSAMTNSYVEHAMVVVEGESVDQLAWRLEAFHTARTLFVYTSFFLVAILVLFHFYTTLPATAASKDKSNADSGVSVDDAPPAASSVSSDSAIQTQASHTSGRPRLDNSLSLGSIPEANSDCGTVENLEGKVHRSVAASDSGSGGTGSSSKRRRMFRFRDSKAASTPLVTTTKPLNVRRGNRDPNLVLHTRSI